MKKLLKIFFVLLFMGLIGGLAGLYFTSGLTSSAEIFFDEIKNENYDGAYDRLSNAFKESSTKEDLVEFLDMAHIKDINTVSWGNRKAEGNQGILQAIVRTNNNQNIPLELHFIKEDSSWKIYSIELLQAGLSQKSTEIEPPSEAEAITLSNESMEQFADAISTKDFSSFHAHISELWSNQSSIEEIREAYEPIWSKEFNLAPVKSSNPNLQTPYEIDERGVLSLNGFYELKEKRAYFRLLYNNENGNWKLIGLNIEIISPPDQET
jgi:3',5'-cyclic AMP phosphodiesterase CpdA